MQTNRAGRGKATHAKRGRPGAPVGDLAYNDWSTLMVRETLWRNGTSDGVIARLKKAGIVGAVRRDVGAEVLRGKLVPPAGKWALLVALQGQPWLYLCPGWQDVRLDEQLAQKAGLATLLTGYQDTAAVTYVVVRKGKEIAVSFQASRYTRDQLKGPKPRPTVRFESRRHKKTWWQSFESDHAVRDGLLGEFGAYVPMMAAGGSTGKVKVVAFDAEGDVSPAAFERVDLLVFGPADAMDSTQAGEKLRAALYALDVEGVRQALAAGASLKVLARSPLSPLEKAIQSPARDREKWLSCMRALLEAGANARGEGGRSALCLLAAKAIGDEDTLVRGLGLLLDHGADIAGRSGPPSYQQGKTVVHILAQMNRLRALEYVLSRGADVRGKDADGKTARQCIEENMKDLEGQGRPGGSIEESLEWDRKTVAFLKKAERQVAKGKGKRGIAKRA